MHFIYKNWGKIMTRIRKKQIEERYGKNPNEIRKKIMTKDDMPEKETWREMIIRKLKELRSAA